MPLSEADKAGIRQGIKDGFNVSILAVIYESDVTTITRIINEPKETGESTPPDAVN